MARITCSGGARHPHPLPLPLHDYPGWVLRIATTPPPPAPGVSDARTGIIRMHAAEWLPRERAHEARADALTAAHRERRSRQERHPIEDFL